MKGLGVLVGGLLVVGAVAGCGRGSSSAPSTAQLEQLAALDKPGSSAARQPSSTAPPLGCKLTSQPTPSTR